MKAYVILLFCCLCIASAIGTVGQFSQVGSGYFSGKMGIFSTGDTLAFVYNAAIDPVPSSIGCMVFKRSFDGGQSWANWVKPNITNKFQRPTLFYSPSDIMLNYTNYGLCETNWSHDNGATWRNVSLGRTFEKSPFMEIQGNFFKRFQLDLPYPEYDQDSYSAQDSEELLTPQVFLNSIQNSNGGATYFTGQDVFWGPVYANSGIYIRQAGGGTNSGWPTFLAPVISTNTIMSQGSPLPDDQIFLGGKVENAPTLEMPDTEYIRQAATLVGTPEYDPDLIVMVTVHGSTYSIMEGRLSTPEIQHAYVYEPYPANPLGDPLFRNTFMVRDTLWTFGIPDGNCSEINFTPNKLWIRGNFSGNQTWCSGDTIMIIGDITLAGTAPGTDPAQEPINNVDKVNLIAEKSILLKYGFKDPIDSLRYHPLCRADNDPVQIYASLYALGDGGADYRKHGVFSFEYQHPHPSVPAVRLGTTLWTWIDLHRRRFPQTSAAHWPANIDYPWYNPLWPESKPYLERGTVHIWGSINQRSKGYLHRSLVDTEVVNPSNDWWIEGDMCGGTSAVNITDPVLNMPLYTQNYPGATGGGIGYKKLHDPGNNASFLHWDTPTGQQSIWKLGMNLGRTTLSENGWVTHPYFRKAQVHKTRTKAFDRLGNTALYAVNDLLVKGLGDEITDLSAATLGDGEIRSVAVAPDGSHLVYQQGIGEMRLKVLDPETGNTAFEDNIHVTTAMNDIAITPNGNKLLAIYQDEQIKFYALNSAQQPVQFDACPFPVPNVAPEMLSRARLYLSPASDTVMDIFLWIPTLLQGGDNHLGDIYHARSVFSVASEDPIAPELNNVRLDTYPNPMRDELQVRMSIPKGVSHRVEIFNLRGQRVKTLAEGSVSPEGDIGYVWNGTDEKGTLCGKGIYLIRLVVDNKPIRVKRICRI